ncbi:hypothetical protein INS49_008978 [Diaporthe citri]|uniref:uncharacterized protein n=1 Tax=Diaporthe citri TaxID=83186 RepID=UPI001C80830B|nr:uncharacterized protein INS49_008978 [Diaporthe citri]KAG6363875.1 hypothetical protein INS49_008978 [Diaporthe citri]
MAPVITLVRHAQGFHNLYRQQYRDDQTLIDPTLTELGKNQCLDVRNQFPHHAKIAAMPEVTANAAEGCNRGHAPEEIIAWAKETFGSDVLDEESFRWLVPYWYKKSEGLYEHNEEKLRMRASVARQIIQKEASSAGDDSHIVVVSHWEFLPYLVGDDNPGPQWKNAECRSYTIEARADGETTLVRIGE